MMGLIPEVRTCTYWLVVVYEKSRNSEPDNQMINKKKDKTWYIWVSSVCHLWNLTKHCEVHCHFVQKVRFEETYCYDWNDFQLKKGGSLLIKMCSVCKSLLNCSDSLVSWFFEWRLSRDISRKVFRSTKNVYNDKYW